MEPKDGVAAVALGLGRMVVEGGQSLRFSPAQPAVLPQFGTVDDWLKNSQRNFYAVDVSNPDAYPTAHDDFNLALLDLADAERHGTLEPIGSVYSPENNAIYDGIHRPGTRLVSFAHVLKSDLFPLAEILKLLLELGRRTMSAEVEIEFAVVLGDGKLDPHQFGFLQIRPLAAGYEAPDIPDGLLDSDDAVGGDQRGPGQRAHGRDPGYPLCAPREIRPRRHRGHRRGDRPVQPRVRDRGGALPAAGTRPLGLLGSLAWHSRPLGPDFRRPGHRGNRPGGFQGDPEPGHPLLSRT